MSARFTVGTNAASTNRINQAGKVAPVQRNSMKGMPGFIKTTQDQSSGGLASSKPVGPRFTVGTTLNTTKKTAALRKSQGASIGSRPKAGGPHYGGTYADNGKFRGSSDVSYRATSTGPAGKIASNKNAPLPKGTSEKEGPARGKPTSGFKQVAGGRSGKMESLRGRARAFGER